ncbi:dimethyl sulfoxide reductase anchor subunit [Stieleria sp. TO1_6]|uniref:DmsC/YnfH family molybdoenzyme membrane anchor subunit n=1 Tax=Stieleria tagensis TaxID=2956795 RepID=UPI00209AECFE|nr:DmsC/YnfH family molybdoenzyme membrane anchor subunit [Stieleria tagensis]MCO8125422.1 dimethyl sulfoxide reductase anchor subunit [Stieleria tagensis]
MSTTLPVINRQPELVGQLLSEQQELSAVDQFSAWHVDHEQADVVPAPAQEQYYRSLLPATAPGPGQQFAFEVDLNSCSGCKACVVACHTMNGLEEDESWRRVGTLLIGDPDFAQPAAIQHVTTACHHCEDPGCLNGCPVKAYDKDPVTGIVRHLDDQCIGCKYCTMMCPYEVPQYSKRLGIVRKCDMCHQRLSVGEAPACVQSCPNEAIKITIVPTQSAPAAAHDSVVPSAPTSSITRPTTKYVSQYAIDPTQARPQDENVDEVAESHWPLALMLVATQVSVGVLISELLATMVLSVAGYNVPASVPLAAALVAFAIGNAGLGIAPLHLGQPLRMWRVFLGLRTSWLSREAVVLAKYMGALAGAIALMALPLVWDWIPTAVQAWIPLEWIPDWAGRALLVLAIPVGLTGLYCSAMIYIATKRQLWRAGRTLPRFFATTLAAGPVITAAVFAFSGFAATAAVLSLASAAVMAWKWNLETAVYLRDNRSGDAYDRRSKRLIWRDLAVAARLRAACAAAAVALCVAAGLVSFVAPLAGGVIAVLAALVLVGGENLERVLYFQSVVYDRMPGTF